MIWTGSKEDYERTIRVYERGLAFLKEQVAEKEALLDRLRAEYLRDFPPPQPPDPEET